MPDDNTEEIRIGVSSCLLGNEVRYDGTHEKDAVLTESLATLFRCVAVCPEVDIGLGVPRETIRLVRNGEHVRLVGTQSAIDHTATMRDYAKRKVAELVGLGISGYVFKSASPSCGLKSAKVHDTTGALPQTGSGIFAAALVDGLPDLPVLEEGDLQDSTLRENFIARVRAYHRLPQRPPPKAADR